MLKPLSYITAGKALFTVVSKKSGNRFTYRAKVKRDLGLTFVSVLTGPDNESSYTFLGTIFSDGVYRHGKRSTITPDAPSAKAFDWFARNMESDAVEFVPSGRCCRCARTLTTPESVAMGIGPECAGKM